MFLIFDQVVDVFKSHLVIDTFTLFTRLGGDVGFCKEIIWVIFITISIGQYARKYLSV